MARNVSFLNALNLLIEEKGFDKDTFLAMLTEAIEKAYKKNYLNPEANVRVTINEKNGNLSLHELRVVVDDLNDEDIEVSLEEALEINKNYKIGDVVETEVDVDLIGRLAAIQTKQLFRQKIRETEKEVLYNEFADKKDDIITGIVDRVEEKFAIVTIGRTGAFLALNQQIPNEKLVEGQHLKVYVNEVERGTKGTHIGVSRVDPNLVKRLFELEVPEVYEGIVEIVSVARDPGLRSKMAVTTKDEDIDPIGACVGTKGARVKEVVDELQGEMIDIIEWSSNPATFITNALSPSDVVSVTLNEEAHSAQVIVPDNQLSLAIGRRGQNARLAVKLTGWKIDIKPYSEALSEGVIVKNDTPVVDVEFEDRFATEMLENNTKEVSEVLEVEEVEEVLETKEVKEVKEVEVVEEAKKVEEVKEEVIIKKVAPVIEEDDEEYEEEYDSKYDIEIDYDAYDEYYDQE